MLQEFWNWLLKGRVGIHWFLRCWSYYVKNKTSLLCSSCGEGLELYGDEEPK